MVEVVVVPTPSTQRDRPSMLIDAHHIHPQTSTQEVEAEAEAEAEAEVQTQIAYRVNASIVAYMGMQPKTVSDHAAYATIPAIT